jgi:drug/metabolite transporter (DMT)-like permease
MFWIFIAFIGPIFHGFANVLDNYLANKLFKNVWTLAFYATLFNILFLPLVLIIEIPGIPTLSIIPFLLIVGVIDILYLFPYYKALQNDDTSIISALFSLGKIFVPFFAFLLVGEKLQLTQYLGFLIIILGSVSLTLNNHRILRLSKSFFYMLFCSILLALEAVVYKYIFEHVGWSTGFVWATPVSTVLALGFLFIPRIRQDIIRHAKDIKRNIPIFVSMEFLTFGGTVAATYAISLVPVTLKESISAFEPFFPLFYALVLGRFFPHLFREHIDRRSVIKKLLIFGIMIIGIILVV